MQEEQEEHLVVLVRFCQLHTDLQLRNYLHQNGLWAGLQGVFLIHD